MGEVAQVTKHAGIIVNGGVFTKIVAPICSVGTHISKDLGEDFGRQADDVVMAGDSGVEDAVVGLFRVLELRARPEVLEKPHDASGKDSAVQSTGCNMDRLVWVRDLPPPGLLRHP
jgi:hypothetical protein